MLSWANGYVNVQSDYRRNFKISDRKLRLFAAACYRLLPGFARWEPDGQPRWCVEAAEALADSLPLPPFGAHILSPLAAAASLAVLGAEVLCWCGEPDAARAALLSCGSDRRQHGRAWPEAGPIRADLLRDIVGNPWRPIVYPCCEGVCRIESIPGDATTLIGGQCDLHGRTYYVERWITPTVQGLAQAAYTERECECGKCDGTGWDIYRDTRVEKRSCPACHGTGRIEDGTLDADRFAVLADALEEARCDNEDVLASLRSPGPHYRGMWVLDIIAGR